MKLFLINKQKLMCGLCYLIALVGLMAVFYLPVCGLIALVIYLIRAKSNPTFQVPKRVHTFYPRPRMVSQSELLASAASQVEESTEWAESQIDPIPFIIDASYQSVT